MSKLDLDSIIPTSNNPDMNYVKDEYKTQEYDMTINENVKKQSRPYLSEINNLNKSNKITEDYINDFTESLLQETTVQDYVNNNEEELEIVAENLENINKSTGKTSKVNKESKNNMTVMYSNPSISLDKSNIIKASRPPFFRRNWVLKTMIALVILISLAVSFGILYKRTIIINKELMDKQEQEQEKEQEKEKKEGLEGGNEEKSEEIKEGVMKLVPEDQTVKLPYDKPKLQRDAKGRFMKKRH